MTPPPDPSELASALVDGMLSADDAARASADPEVAALAREFEALRSELQAVPPAPDIGRATAVSAALDAVAGDASRGAPGSPPASQAPYPATERSGRPWLIAVASVILLVLAVGVISQLGGDDSEDLSATPGDASTETADEAPTASSDDLESEEFDSEEQRDDSADGATEEEAAGEGGEGNASAENEPVGDVIDLGPVEDVDELVAGVGVGAGTSTEAPAPQAEPSEGLEERDEAADAGECPAFGPAGDPRYGEPNRTATAVLDGEDVWVHVYPTTGNRGRLVVTDASCDEVASRSVNL